MSPDLILTSGQTVLRLRPGWGGRVVTLTHAGQHVLYPLQQEGGFTPALWPKGGAYPLFPFHNRIPQGRMVFAGRSLRLPLHPCEEHAVHGHAHQHGWSVTHHSTGGAELSYEDDGRGAWPWRFAARQGFTLRAGGLDLALTITNLAADPMPAGLGWHPFFAKAARIATDARREWQAGADLLPGGTWHAPRPGATTRHLSDASRAELTLASGLVVRMQADPPLTHLVIHDPAGRYSCVEPVSHLANAMNLHDCRPCDALVPLPPGQSLAARLRLRFG